MERQHQHHQEYDRIIIIIIIYIYIYISSTTVVANVEQSLSSWLNLEAASEVG